MALWEGGFRDMDPLTMSAIVQMQLDDIEQLKTNHKGKQREGTVTDAQLALQMYNEDLRACDHTLKDRQMAQSLCLAVLRDGDLIRRAYEEEQQANRDHELAMRLSRNELPRVIPRKRAQSRDSDPWSDDEELLYKAAATYMHRPASVQGMRLSGLADDTEDTTMAESSTWAAARKASDKPLMRRCASCFEEKEFFDVARVPCNDEYCRPCLAQLFELSMKDESLYPPKCHGQVIPVCRVSFFLPQRLVKEFQRKAPELDCKDRTYCHGRSCSTFIPPAAISNDIGKCPRCQKTTCTMCKGPSHSGDCPEDTALQKLAETADQKQWQRCFSCKRFVELRYGCKHISCRCGAQFCYVCGMKWHTCGCDTWDERRLTNRAAEIIDRNPRRQLWQPARVAHAQPPSRRPSLAANDVLAGPAARDAFWEALVADGPASPGWEEDVSDHSLWDEDWMDDVANEEPLQTQTLSEIQVDEQMAALEPFGLPGAAQPDVDNARQPRIAQTAEHLRVMKDCTHERWRSRRGSHRCEECHDFLEQYIFECRQCHLHACNRCRSNRL